MKRDLDYYLNLPYRIEIVPSPEGGYAAKVVELPGCISQGQTLEEVAINIEDAKVCWLEVALEESMPIPEPMLNNEEYSGKMVVRMPKSMHRLLVERAKEENISLNQYINYQLARGIGIENLR
ncbi:MAG: toxin-antitoxin system HicB family antitoxin [Firmicutes bacterium HGW-Firmicutes-8]|nr:MAG: toxin-antitoxin system HicB family antitoxin [Firmicutes bacterium HGW-Firmicutes-8]